MLREYFTCFRPRLIPTLIAGAGIVLLLALGTWQVFRLFEKTAINNFRAERVAAAPTPLPARIDNLAEWEFRRVTVAGAFAHAHELHLNARSQRGNNGYQIITPLLREGAPPVLVSRGWVPYERKNPATRAEGQVAGPVTVEGILRTEARKGWLMPANDAARNEWFWYDLPAMEAASGVPNAAPFYIEAGPSPNPGGFPIGGQTLVQLPSNHLGYALTWYALAIALAVIYVVSQSQKS